jgi:uncharacterized protein (DUF302 family)
VESSTSRQRKATIHQDAREIPDGLACYRPFLGSAPLGRLPTQDGRCREPALGEVSNEPVFCVRIQGGARVITTAGHHSVAETVERLRGSLERRSITVFATIDHAAAAREVGLELPDETVVVFGDPRAGTPLMETDPTVGIELPLRVLVWDDGGTTMVGYHDPTALANGYQLNGLQGRLERMRELVVELVSEAVA